jgi:hypothetical protein
VLDGPPNLARRGAGRPGFVNMLCFSRRHTLPARGTAGFAPVDVLERGVTTYPKAMGERACRVAVDYCARYVDGGSPAAAAATALDDGDDDERAAVDAAAVIPVLDPFCGRGSVLAAANRIGGAAYGIDLCAASCRQAHVQTTSSRAPASGVVMINEP